MSVIMEICNSGLGIEKGMKRSSGDVKIRWAPDFPDDFERTCGKLFAT